MKSYPRQRGTHYLTNTRKSRKAGKSKVVRVDSQGYVVLVLRDHPAATSIGTVYEHRILAEKALGKYLSKSQPVHHIDGNRTNNRNDNLVICENHKYHMLLHSREKTVKQGGNPNTQKLCNCCKLVKDKSLFWRASATVDGLQKTCIACRKIYAKQNPRKGREKPDTKDAKRRPG